MKKFLISVIIVTLIICFCSCNKTFDGYYYNLEDARNEEQKYYEQYDYLFTAEEEDILVDFIIDGEQINIISFRTRERNDKIQYRLTDIHSTILSYNINSFKDENQYVWEKEGLWENLLEWSVVTEEFNKSHNNYKGFSFSYNENEFFLCYRISE